MAQSENIKVNVDIHHQQYTIVGKESANHVQLVASLVDQKMKEMKNNNPQLDTTRLAVLTAVNTMNDYLKLKEDYAALIGSKRKEDK